MGLQWPTCPFMTKMLQSTTSSERSTCGDAICTSGPEGRKVLGRAPAFVWDSTLGVGCAGDGSKLLAPRPARHICEARAREGRAGMIITVRVHPRASRPKASWNGNLLEVWVTAPPVGGAANKAVMKAVADQLDVPVSTVILRSGMHGRTKVVEVLDVAG